MRQRIRAEKVFPESNKNKILFIWADDGSCWATVTVHRETEIGNPLVPHMDSLEIRDQAIINSLRTLIDVAVKQSYTDEENEAAVGYLEEKVK